MKGTIRKYHRDCHHLQRHSYFLILITSFSVTFSCTSVWRSSAPCWFSRLGVFDFSSCTGLLSSTAPVVAAVGASESVGFFSESCRCVYVICFQTICLKVFWSNWKQVERIEQLVILKDNRRNKKTSQHILFFFKFDV